MITRRVLLVSGLAALATPLAAAAQPAGKVYRIGCLSATSESTAAQFFAPFRERLRELNYVEGRNIAFEYRWADGRYERLGALATELVHLPVDLIFATSAPAASAAKRATSTIPIVMRITADPVEIGLAKNLTRPGGNVTGVADFVAPNGKHLELLKQVLPRLKRVAILKNPAGVQTPSQLKGVMEFASALGLQLHVVEARTAEELEGAVEAAARSGSGAMTILSDGLFTIHRRRLAELALKSRLPATYQRREFAEAGGFFSYGSGLGEQYRQAAGVVNRILQGARPADLPIEQPTKFELVINRKTANALGLTIPPSLLLRADQVIE